MEEQTPRSIQPLVKALIGLGGLCYFFMTSDEVWGEAIGLTLFFASGQLQTIVKPPLSRKMLCSISSDDLLETWRIMIGMASCFYYFYFVMYLRRSTTIYTSTVCLSLFWESQIVDDLINLLSYWLSSDLATTAKSITKILSTNEKSVKQHGHNLVQDFLCVLCKLYKHLIMNFTKMNCFLLSQVKFDTVATNMIMLNKLRSNEEVTLNELLFDQIQNKLCANSQSADKACPRKAKCEGTPLRDYVIGSKLRNSCYGKNNFVPKPSIPFTTPQIKSRNPSSSVIIRKQAIRFPVF